MNEVLSLTLHPATQLNAIRPTLTNPEPELAIPPEQIPFDQNSTLTRFTRDAITPHAHCQSVPSQPMFQQWCNKHTNMTQKIHCIANCKKVNIIIHLLSCKMTMTHANDSTNPAKFRRITLHKPTWPNSTTEGAHSPALYDKNIPMTYQLETTSTIQRRHVCFRRMPDNIKCTMLPWVGSLTQSHTQTRPPVQPLLNQNTCHLTTYTWLMHHGPQLCMPHSATGITKTYSNCPSSLCTKCGSLLPCEWNLVITH